MAIDAGLIREPCQLVHDGQLAHFTTRRLEQPGPTERLDVQSLAAMPHLPP